MNQFLNCIKDSLMSQSLVPVFLNWACICDKFVLSYHNTKIIELLTNKQTKYDEAETSKILPMLNILCAKKNCCTISSKKFLFLKKINISAAMSLSGL